MEKQRAALYDLVNNSWVVYDVRAASAFLYFLAAIPNTLLLVMILRRKKLRTLINWAICNLLFSNILRAFSMGIYSAVKASQFSSGLPPPGAILSSKTSCIAMLGLTLLFRYGPLWSLCLWAFVLAIQFGPNKWLQKNFTFFRFAELRIAMWLIDLAHTCFLLQAMSSQHLDRLSHCTWQIMVIASQPYEFYHWILIHILVILGIVVAAFKFYSMDQAAPVGGEVNGKTRLKRILLLLGFSITVATFLIPKFAYVRYSFSFWLTSETLCPAVMAIIMPFLLILAIPSLRDVADEELGKSKKLFSKKDNSDHVSNSKWKGAESAASILPRTDSKLSESSAQENKEGKENPSFDHSVFEITDSQEKLRENKDLTEDKLMSVSLTPPLKRADDDSPTESVETVAEVHVAPKFS